MHSKSLIVAAVLALALVGPKASQAQSTGEGAGSGGQTCLQAATGTDVSPTAGLDLNLLVQLRAGVFSTFSWGRGTMGRPGSLRSSIAVLRERRGLMLR